MGTERQLTKIKELLDNQKNELILEIKKLETKFDLKLSEFNERFSDIKKTADLALELAEQNAASIDCLKDQVDSLTSANTDLVIRNVALINDRIKLVENSVEDRTNRSLRKTLVIKGVKEINDETWEKTEHLLALTISNHTDTKYEAARDMIERAHRSKPTKIQSKQGQRDIYASIYDWKVAEFLKDEFRKINMRDSTVRVYVEQKYGVITSMRRNHALSIRKQLKLEDVVQEENIAEAVNKIAEVVGDNGLNFLINNAACMDKNDNCIENVTAESFRRSYHVNTIAPAMIVKAFLPLLRKASSLVPDDKMGVSRAAILNVASRMGSIGDNSSARSYSYRMSKAALHMLVKNLSIELKPDNILATNIHPGWVMTDMGGPDALITTQKSVESMMKLVSNFTENDSGMFYSWDGTIIPW